MPTRYTVQVGAFSEPENAVSLQRDVVRLYPEAVVDSDGTWNRVQIGAFDDRDQAEKLRRELAAMGMPASSSPPARRGSAEGGGILSPAFSL